MRVYLAGPINGCSDAECQDWRAEAKRLLGDGVETIDPMSRDYRGKEGDNVDDIVEGDCRDIEACDVVLVNAQRPSWGTAMEIRFAWERGKRVVAFTSSPTPSPWLAYHAVVVPTLEAAVELLPFAELFE